MSFVIDICIKLWDAYSKYKENKEALDFFRFLVKFSDLNADKFVESTLINIVPTILDNEKKEEKVKREITKYCTSITKVIEEMKFGDVFPEFKEKKTCLLNKLREFENLSIEELNSSFATNIEKINNEVKSKDGKNLTEIRGEVLKHMNSFTRRETPPISFSTPQDYQNFIDYTKQNFYGVTGTVVDRRDYYGNYVDSSVSMMISEYIPYTEKKPPKMIVVKPDRKNLLVENR